MARDERPSAVGAAAVETALVTGVKATTAAVVACRAVAPVMAQKMVAASHSPSEVATALKEAVEAVGLSWLKATVIIAEDLATAVSRHELQKGKSAAEAGEAVGSALVAAGIVSKSALASAGKIAADAAAQRAARGDAKPSAVLQAARQAAANVGLTGDELTEEAAQAAARAVALRAARDGASPQSVGEQARSATDASSANSVRIASKAAAYAVAKWLVGEGAPDAIMAGPAEEAARAAGASFLPAALTAAQALAEAAADEAVAECQSPSEIGAASLAAAAAIDGVALPAAASHASQAAEAAVLRFANQQGATDKETADWTELARAAGNPRGGAADKVWKAAVDAVRAGETAHAVGVAARKVANAEQLSLLVAEDLASHQAALAVISEKEASGSDPADTSAAGLAAGLGAGASQESAQSVSGRLIAQRIAHKAKDGGASAAEVGSATLQALRSARGGLQLPLTEEAMLAAAAAANASAHAAIVARDNLFHTGEVRATVYSLSKARSVGVDARQTALAAGVNSAYASYIAARVAAAAAADRAEFIGAAAATIGETAFAAAAGTGVPVLVAAFLSAEASAAAGARRSKATGAVAAALSSLDLTPEQAAQIGAFQAAQAVAHACAASGKPAADCGAKAKAEANALLQDSLLKNAQAKAIAARVAATAVAQQAIRFGAEPPEAVTAAKEAALAAGATSAGAERLAAVAVAAAAAKAAAEGDGAGDAIGRAAREAVRTAHLQQLEAERVAAAAAAKAAVEEALAQNVASSDVAKAAIVAVRAAGARTMQVEVVACEEAAAVAAQRAAARGADPVDVGRAAASLATSVATETPEKPSASVGHFLSLRKAEALAAEAAVEAVMRQELQERYADDAAVHVSTEKALKAVHGTLAGQLLLQLAKVLARVITDFLLSRGNSKSIGTALRHALDVLERKSVDGQSLADSANLAVEAGKTAADVLSTAMASSGERCVDINAACGKLLQELALPAHLKDRLAAESATQACAHETAAIQQERPSVVGSSAKRAALGTGDLSKDVGVHLAARIAAEEVATARAASGLLPAQVAEAAQAAARAAGADENVAAWLAAASAAEAAALQSGFAGAPCYNVGQAARTAVSAAGLPGSTAQGSDPLLILAVPAAVEAALRTAMDTSSAEELGDRARAAAEGALGTDASGQLWGAAADLTARHAALEAARQAVAAGRLPFQVASAAMSAADAVGLPRKDLSEVDGQVAVDAILRQALQVGTPLKEAAKLARVAAEAGGLPMHAAGREVCKQLAEKLAAQQAVLSGDIAVEKSRIAQRALDGAAAAGCNAAEAAWIGSRAAAAAAAEAAAEAGASPEAIALAALTAAQAGLPGGEAQRVAARSAARAACSQVLKKGGTSDDLGSAARRAVQATGVVMRTGSRVAAQEAVQAALLQARRQGRSTTFLAATARAAALSAGLLQKAAGLLTAKEASLKAAAAAASAGMSAEAIGTATRTVAEAANATDEAGQLEAAVAAGQTAAQFTAFANTLDSAKVAQDAVAAWNSAGSASATAELCPYRLAVQAILQRMVRDRFDSPEDIGKAVFAAKEASRPTSCNATDLVASVIAKKAVAKGGAPQEVAPVVRTVLDRATSGISEDELKRIIAEAASRAIADVEAAEGRQPANVGIAAKKAAAAAGISAAEARRIAAAAAAAALAKEGRRSRLSTAIAAGQSIAAARAAGSGLEDAERAATAAAAQEAAKAAWRSGADPKSAVEAAWSAAIPAGIGKKAASEIESLVSKLVEDAFRAHAQLTGVPAGEEEEDVKTIRQAAAHLAQNPDAAAEAYAAAEAQAVKSAERLRRSGGEHSAAWELLIPDWLRVLFLLAFAGCLLAGFCLRYFSNTVGRNARRFCCSKTPEEVYKALGAEEADPEDTSEAARLMRPAWTVRKYSWWVEDRFGGPSRVAVVLEKAALESCSQLLDPEFSGAEPDLHIAYDALAALLSSRLNKAGRLLIYIHSVGDKLVEVHPALELPGTVKGFAAMVDLLLHKDRCGGMITEGVPMMRVIYGKLQQQLPKGCPRIALSPQGENVQLKDFLQELMQPSGSSTAAPSSEPSTVVFAVGVSRGDATKDPRFGAGYTTRRISLCPWDLRASACCQMVCHEYETLWQIPDADHNDPQ
eukprot:TRINITY_DN31990_c0_g1_i1.p1 TRINITY_DN31990_c0_g1~~TRINITY_DN31990_c0_g1_i1.p1  ORF type:complete len:2327 (+),score=694.41 TRINITY_DN31990_c0_g1_i1:578-6982(+)